MKEEESELKALKNEWKAKEKHIKDPNKWTKRKASKI